MPDLSSDDIVQDTGLEKSDPAIGDTEAVITVVDNPSTSSISTQQTNTRPQGRLCGVCHESEAKYKCSRCEVPYCSVACSTLHRATHPAAVDGSNHASMNSDTSKALDHESKPPPSYLTISKGPRDVFAPLRTSRDLQTLFLIYPRLRSQLREIYTATLPPGDQMAQNRKDPAKGGVGRSWAAGSSGGWNHDRGMQDGIDALAKAKIEYGKSGEGVREYSDLILKQVSTEDVDVSQLVQDEVAEENAKLIASLLNGEPY